MKSNFLSNKLDELYKKEQYRHPQQRPIKPDVSITGEKPEDDSLNSPVLKPKFTDKDDIEKDLGNKGSQKDLGLKGDEKDLGTDKKSKPKDLDFEGPRVSIQQED